MALNLALHPIARLLCDTGLSAPDSFVPISERVRDRADVYALRCDSSGVIILNRTDHIQPSVYEDRRDLSYWGEADRAKLLEGTADDDHRRAESLKAAIGGKRVLDVGTGLGGFLDRIAGYCALAEGVEPQAGPREANVKAGHRVFESVGHAPVGAYDVISLFHVYEHIPEPVDFMREVKSRLAPGGQVFVEVPHAGDALITLYQSKAFLDFTLWSQHLILHTARSLEAFLRLSGFGKIEIKGVQRYPVANHMRWLAEGKPGGHRVWDFLNSPAMAAAYQERLASVDRTDTLLAIASV